MDEKHPLAFPLMQWIIATCRAHIILLPQPRRIKSMKTEYQFLLISSPPAKEVTFQQAKQKHGSTYAFHGSSIENWHSIMRKGLINATGTKLQLHGAAYGRGIYLSPLSSVSFGYTGRHFAYHVSSGYSDVTECLASKTNLKCLALCEGMCCMHHFMRQHRTIIHVRWTLNMIYAMLSYCHIFFASEISQISPVLFSNPELHTCIIYFWCMLCSGNIKGSQEKWRYLGVP
jgi:hypothetical protein